MRPTSGPFSPGYGTGVAVIAFGFLVERFDLFILTMIDAVSPRGAAREQLETLSHSFGRGAGEALILVGIAFIFVATIRFVRTGILLDDQKIHAPGIFLEISLSVILAIHLIAASLPLILPSL
jgi:inner membrane protein YidH